PQLRLLKPYPDGAMVKVADEGPVKLGSNEDAFNRIPKNQTPQHEAGLKTFYVDRTEATVQQYVRFLYTDQKTGRALENVPEEKVQELCFLCRKHDPSASPYCHPFEPQLPTGHMPPIDPSNPLRIF